MRNYLIESVQIVNPDLEFEGSVLIENGKIKNVWALEDLPREVVLPMPLERIDGKGKKLLPGFIDPHVHFRDPGLTHKEDFESGSRAAVSGGITTIFDMPNTIPPTFTLVALEEKRKIAAEKSCVNFGFFAGVCEDSLPELKKMKNIPGIKLYLDSTTGNLKSKDEDFWRKVFGLGKKVALHAEGETFLRAVEIWKEEGCPCELHLCHTSLKIEVEALRDLKSNTKTRKKITAEVMPHHLLLTEKDFQKHGNFCAMKPPLASVLDQATLWEAVEEGTIDFIATDHAPHTLAEKKSENIIYGVPGVETMFPLLWTAFEKRGISHKKFVQMTSSNAARAYHLHDKKGFIKKGFDADLVLIDQEKIEKISAEHFFSKAGWTPFEGWKFTGKIEKTFVGGTLVFDNGKIISPDFRGREVRFH